MRSIWWPVSLLLVLWLCATVILPAWFGTLWVPRLVLAGLVVLAVTDIEFKWYWCAPAAGLVYDITTGVLPGTYMVAFAFLYIFVRTIFFRVVPSDKIVPAVGVAFIVATVLLGVWLGLVSAIAIAFNYPIVPMSTWSVFKMEFARTLIGAAAAIGIYLIWLEFIHMFSKPIRLRRL